MAKTRPDSLTPRRFIRVSSTTKATDRTTSWSLRAGTAEVMAETPETTETATVIT